jgi:hypothetical protein
MTETEWLAPQREPYLMLEALRHKGSARKRRLYACACCRLVWTQLTDARSRKAIAVAERYADEMASKHELVEAEREARAARDMAWAAYTEAIRARAEAMPEAQRAASYTQSTAQVAMQTAGAATWCCALTGFEPSANVNYYDSVGESAVLEVVELLSEGPGYAVFGFVDPLRDIFGNPYRPVTIDPAWLTPTVVRLAKALNEDDLLVEGALDSVRLAVLADALEEAGCASEEVLSHCRSAGHHVRGCWVVDRLLGKS